MNIHTFKDAVASKRQAISNELADEDDDDEDNNMKVENVDGEESDGEDKYNDAGEAFEPFNLKSDRETGYFDSDMNYVWKKEHAEVDTWLANMDEATMEKSIGEAAIAKRKYDEIRKKSEREADSQAPPDVYNLKNELLAYLKPGETILKAIRRIGNTASKNTIQYRKSPEYQKNKFLINRLTEIADTLLSYAKISNIYDITDEAIAIYGDDVKWEYQGDDGVIHGTYTTNQIAEWKKEGYFTGKTAVMMRLVPSVVKPTRVSFASSVVSNNPSQVLDRGHLGDIAGFGGGGDINDARKNKRRFDDMGSKKPIAKGSEHQDNSDLMKDLDSEDDEEYVDEMHVVEGEGDSNDVKKRRDNDKVVAETNGAKSANMNIPLNTPNSSTQGASSTFPDKLSHIRNLFMDWISSEDIDFGIAEDIHVPGKNQLQSRGYSGNKINQDIDDEEYEEDNPDNLNRKRNMTKSGMKEELSDDDE